MYKPEKRVDGQYKLDEFYTEKFGTLYKAAHCTKASHHTLF